MARILACGRGEACYLYDMYDMIFFVVGLLELIRLYTMQSRFPFAERPFPHC
jgi:hypothetical protein